jgi:hypothetical protein
MTAVTLPKFPIFALKKKVCDSYFLTDVSFPEFGVSDTPSSVLSENRAS